MIPTLCYHARLGVSDTAISVLCISGHEELWSTAAVVDRVAHSMVRTNNLPISFQNLSGRGTHGRWTQTAWWSVVVRDTNSDGEAG